MAEEDEIKRRTNNPKSYQVRKECIKRKSMELATLCDIKVCTVITGPNGELQTWPDDFDACKQVLDLYSQNLKPEKKYKESSTPESEPEPEPEPEPEQGEEEGEKDLLTLVESTLAAVNRRIRTLENKGKRKRIE
ncbi:hypothetical protein EJD97_012193 [Solanum chilense]|uniref:MADS-box domain-containing protein n=1 Tax=Solanum chilense TaxID=4083 RepID=A0A6N2BK44_SOLCI|nr:hypothetical protein EJD97_012193 [Solanum chilense]